jgi:predicted Zn-dependent protease
MAKGQFGQLLATAVGVAASDDRGGNSSAVLAQVANQMIQLKYSRSDELEADSYGLRYMIQAGYDPRQMLRVMEILKQASGSGRQPSILATHPDPDARIEQINEFLKKNYPNGVPANLSMGRALNPR